ncbi:hypothetical protein BOX15_Mlig024448g1, partial [Macrostomum lignano]
RARTALLSCSHSTESRSEAMVSEAARSLRALEETKPSSEADRGDRVSNYDDAGPLESVSQAAAADAAAEEETTGEAEAEAPIPEAPISEAPIAEAPIPEAPIPEAAIPEAAIPEAAIPEAAIPEAAIPEAAIPEAAIPEATAEAEPAGLDPLLVEFDSSGRSCLARFDKAAFDRALGAHLPSLFQAGGVSAHLRDKMRALLEASPAGALPYEFSLLFSSTERRQVCDLRAAACLDYYLDRFASSFRDLPSSISIGECDICFAESVLVRQRRCCRLLGCSACLADHTRFALAKGRPYVGCPSCPVLLSRDEIRLLCLRGRPDLLHRYNQLLADAERLPDAKTCPDCGHVCRRDQDSGVNDVECEACGFAWCFACHGPHHPGRRCPDSADSDGQLLTAWSREMRPDPDMEAAGVAESRRARHCPECRALIERNGGCRYVSCTVCRTEFCYLCGKRLVQEGRYFGLLPRRLLGGHSSRLSVFGCSAEFLPDRPRLRRAIRRGLLGVGIGGAVIVALTASPLLLLASPVWAPLLAVRERRRRRQLGEQRLP